MRGYPTLSECRDPRGDFPPRSSSIRNARDEVADSREHRSDLGVVVLVIVAVSRVVPDIQPHDDLLVVVKLVGVRLGQIAIQGISLLRLAVGAYQRYRASRRECPHVSFE